MPPRCRNGSNGAAVRLLVLLLTTLTAKDGVLLEHGVKAFCAMPPLRASARPRQFFTGSSPTPLYTTSTGGAGTTGSTGNLASTIDNVDSDAQTKRLEILSSRSEEDVREEIKSLATSNDGNVRLTELIGDLESLTNSNSSVFPITKEQFKEFLKEWDKLVGLLAQAKALRDAIVTKAIKTAASSRRVAQITAGLDEELKHDLDFNLFKKRVDDLFRWYEYGEFRTYTGPYFPMIQSSGMGKTRLMMALREWSEKNKCDFDCFVILCSDDTYEDGEFNFRFTLPSLSSMDDIKDENVVRESVNSQLDAIYRTSKKDKIVLLFDEAQCTTQRTKDGYAFRCVRWWLRRKRKKQVVAVFTGTTSNLANYYKDKVPAVATRGFENPRYWNTFQGKMLYEPFFSIATCGCYSDEAGASDSTGNVTFETVAYFGRPLFAHLQKTDALQDDDVQYSILRRMLLKTKGSDWLKDTHALYSILGSRIQMGITTSVALSSALVSEGYANLVSFEPEDANGERRIAANVVFMPDPVCAALAMGLMTPGWTLKSTDNEPLIGTERPFWSKTAMEMFKSGLCLPEKGNAGEIMAALYMLFCGDILREQNQTPSFSIPLQQWLSLLKDPNANVSNFKRRRYW